MQVGNDLEKRLEDVNTSGIQYNLVKQLRQRKIIDGKDNYEEAKKSYLIKHKNNKDMIIKGIIKMINDYSNIKNAFKSSLKHKVRKEQLKGVYCGIICMKDYKENLGKIISKLNGWEKVCFFAGVWEDRTISGRGFNHRDVPSLVRNYICVGCSYLDIKNLQYVECNRMNIPPKPTKNNKVEQLSLYPTGAIH